VTASDAAGNLSVASAAGSATVAVAPAPPVVQTVVSDADTMVAAVNPAQVYGSSDQLSSRGDSAIWSFMQFTLPAAPEGYTLASAQLRVVTSNDATAASGDTHQVQLVTQPWSETTTTWNNRPTAVASGVLGELTGASTLRTAYTVPLAVQDISGQVGQAITLRVSSASGSDNVRFLSRETAAAGSRPQLVLTYQQP
jgi:hypothetical protein